VVYQSLYLPTDAQESCFKRMLTFKQLLHVSVQLPSSGSALFELAKVIVVKIILKYMVVINSVVWLHILLGSYWCMCSAHNMCMSTISVSPPID
jgi:hypothetical protein